MRRVVTVDRVSSPRHLAFGMSPCPNDTFAFWAATHGALSSSVALEPVLLDIEALNERALRAPGEESSGAPHDVSRDILPVSKLSLPALARCLDRYAVLASGAALGFGCGPLVVCRADDRWHSLDQLAEARVAVPGVNTTAFLLLSNFAPPPREVVPMRFEQVMPAVARGDCDVGLVIHESRFTYAEHGLRELADLGVIWEQATGGPLPLGVIAARRDLDQGTFDAVESLLRQSVRLARAEPERPRAWVREHAQELADDVCDRHVALYVNAFTEDLGQRGRHAIDELLRRGREAGLLPAGGSPWREVRS